MTIRQKEWEDICYRSMQITNYTKLQWLQFRIINNILSTNSLLNKMKLLDWNQCSFCKLESETISHLMYNCDIVKTFWCQYLKFLNRNMQNLPLPKDTQFSHHMGDSTIQISHQMFVNL